MRSVCPTCQRPIANHRAADPATSKVYAPGASTSSTRKWAAISPSIRSRRNVGCSRGTVANELDRAKHCLRDYLEDWEPGTLEKLFEVAFREDAHA